MHLLAKQLTAIDRTDLIPHTLIRQFPALADDLAARWGEADLEHDLLALLMLDETQAPQAPLPQISNASVVRELMRLSVAYIDLLAQIKDSQDVWSDVREQADLDVDAGYVHQAHSGINLHGNTSDGYGVFASTLMPQVQNDAEWSPLMQASFSGRLARVLAALEKRPNLAQQDSDGYQAMHLAAMQGHLPVLNALLAAGAHVDVRSYRGITPLILAAGAGHLACVDLLLAQGASPNHARSDGQTALHQAAAHGHDALVVRLLQAKANPLLETHAGQTALNLVPRHKTRMAELLERAIPQRNMHVLSTRQIVSQPLIDWS